MIQCEELEEVQVAEDYFHVQACICFVVGLFLGLAFKVASILLRTENGEDPPTLRQLIWQKTHDFFTHRPHIGMAMAQPLPRLKIMPDEIATRQLNKWTSNLEQNVQWRILERDVNAHCFSTKTSTAKVTKEEEYSSEDIYEEIADEPMCSLSETPQEPSDVEETVGAVKSTPIISPLPCLRGMDISLDYQENPKNRERRELRWIEIVERSSEEINKRLAAVEHPRSSSNWQKQLSIGLLGLLICLIVLVFVRHILPVIVLLPKFEKVFLEQIHDFVTQKIIALFHFK